MRSFGNPHIGNVVRKDGTPLEKGLPEYLVEPVEYNTKDCEQLEQVQLIDFGEGLYFFLSSPHRVNALIQPISSLSCFKPPGVYTYTNVTPSPRAGISSRSE